MGLIARRQLLWTGAVAAAAVAYPIGIEPEWLELTHTEVRANVRSRVRLLHFSDLHASWAVPMRLIERAIGMGLSSDPDVICVTGDFITHRSDFDEARYARVLRRLSAARPTFATLGNHDGGSWAGKHRGTRITRLWSGC